MQKKVFLVCLGLTFALASFARTSGVTQPQVVRSSAFEEPEQGASRLLLMKNGHTLFFHFTLRKGINVTVYNPQHEAQPVVNNRLSSWSNRRMVLADLKGIYEINGEAVVFLQQYVHRRPSLYRLVFDSNTGQLKEEKLIADLAPLRLTRGYRYTYGGMRISEFELRKDPVSDYYAVSMLTYEKGEERIRVLHFDPQHQVINKGDFAVPARDFKYLNMADMYVNGGNNVFLAAFAFNMELSFLQSSRFAIASLAKGTEGFKTAWLPDVRDKRLRDAALKFNTADKNVYLLSALYTPGTRLEPIMSRNMLERFALLMHVIDPEQLTVKQHYFVAHPQLNEYAKTHLKYKRNYQGVIQDFYLHPDGGTTLLLEEMDIFQETIKDGMLTDRRARDRFDTHNNYKTRLGEIGITRLDADGKEAESYAIAKGQENEGGMQLFMQHKRRQSRWNFRDNAFTSNLSGFYSYDYFRKDNKDYVIYNDYAGNTKNREEDYRSKYDVRVVSNSNTVFAVYDGKQIVKNYLFGQPDENASNRFCHLEMIARKEDSNSFATMMVEKSGHQKQAYIVWVNI
ncbi:hypothetical protein [Chitinophaga nivalis]|uniref:6-bladed beta-propeller n=1 Tax=Chitinophaga nivalis TaxID=2991709 RepID=A0ABT3IR11_9BACT|nr:hypothetical protein [Chitinophaga nivalis]MCW3463915.1 hypothetical protein [Chitinophaga nivalis]MCW3486395.1 hypothetical protein [Chitinophaga nivalis]